MIQLPILRGISGIARPRRLMCLVGASGAGKSTLLDVLAGRKTQGEETGRIELNGRSTCKTERAAQIAYCEQTDEHLPTMTVEESLDFSARLRLDAEISNDQDERKAFVLEIMKLLELDSIRRRPAGSLSVGEAKRLTIGCELVSNPSVLFLDEPTTGLDARSAVQVMHVLRNVAETGRTVICTIHQPSYAVFSAFDDMLLLATGGRQIYFGPIGDHCDNFIAYMQRQRTVARRPALVNPATWVLNELEAERQRVDAIISGRRGRRAPMAVTRDATPPEHLSDAVLALQTKSPLLHEAFADSALLAATKRDIEACRTSGLASLVTQRKQG